MDPGIGRARAMVSGAAISVFDHVAGVLLGAGDVLARLRRDELEMPVTHSVDQAPIAGRVDRDAAFNDAVNRINAESQAKMSAATAGMPLPPGMKLPF